MRRHGSLGRRIDRDGPVRLVAAFVHGGRDVAVDAGRGLHHDVVAHLDGADVRRGVTVIPRAHQVDRRVRALRSQAGVETQQLAGGAVRRDAEDTSTDELRLGQVVVVVRGQRRRERRESAARRC